MAILLIAALAFDVGTMLLERRDEQNAADAAALAAARYVFEPDCIAPTWTCTKARAAAIEVALENGFDDADANETVAVRIPAQQGRYVGFPNFVEVNISATRPSIFGGVMGRGVWPVSVFAVATNDQELNFPFSMLGLNPTACKAIKVSGQGEVIANGNVQSNSNGSEAGCGGIGLSRSGGGELTINASDATCRSAGTIQDQGSGTMTCTQAPNSFALPDPLRNLAAPARPALAAAMTPVGHAKAVPDYCPGAVAPAKLVTQTSAQQTCDPGGGKPASQYKNLAWILRPGLYPNGIHVTNGNVVYLLPGVYWIEGGGFDVTGGSTVISIKDVADANANPNSATWSGDKCEMDPTTPATVACGVLIYNSKDTSVPFAAGPISLGGNGGKLLLSYLDVPPADPYATYNTMSIFQDRTVTNDITFNGSTADGEVGGIVYAPAAHVQLNGSSSGFTLDQIIADTFTVNGNVGTIQILKRVGIDALITAAGLVD